jgi:hypothetical protein
MVTLAQVGVALTVIFTILPVLSPHLGGAEAELAQIAARELTDREVVLYDVRPEVVAFGLEQTVTVLGSDLEDELVARAAARPTALIAPAEHGRVWEHLHARRRWQSGNRVLLDIVPTDCDPPAQGGR